MYRQTHTFSLSDKRLPTELIDLVDIPNKHYKISFPKRFELDTCKNRRSDSAKAPQIVAITGHVNFHITQGTLKPIKHVSHVAEAWGNDLQRTAPCTMRTKC